MLISMFTCLTLCNPLYKLSDSGKCMKIFIWGIFALSLITDLRAFNSVAPLFWAWQHWSSGQVWSGLVYFLWHHRHQLISHMMHKVCFMQPKKPQNKDMRENPNITGWTEHFLVAWREDIKMHEYGNDTSSCSTVTITALLLVHRRLI